MNKNSLSDLFSIEDQQVIEMNHNKILLLDFHNICYRTVFASVFTNPEDNGVFDLWKHMLMNNIMSLVDKFKPTKMILASDVKGSWRYEVYSEYKSHRKAARDKAVVDFEKFFPVLNSFKQDIKDTFKTMYVLEAPRSEADDIIAVLSRDVFKDQQVTIVSTDSDMQQLLMLPNVQLYEPIKNKMIQSINPKRELELKILTGDKSDGIPAIKPRVGIATAEALLKNGLQKLLDEDATIKQNYVRNTTLIDFSYIPQDVATSIINTYNQYEKGKIDSNKLMMFFSKNKLRRLMEDWQNYSEVIKNLQ
jgi:5'-3' exonuclease